MDKLYGFLDDRGRSKRRFYPTVNIKDVDCTTLEDHRCFFVVKLLLERLDRRVMYLAAKTHQLEMTDADLGVLTSIISDQERLYRCDMRYVVLLRAYPDETDQSARAESTLATVAVPECLLELAEARTREERKQVLEEAENWKSDDSESPLDDDDDDKHEGFYICVSKVAQPAPGVREFVRDLVALAEESILGVDNQHLVLVSLTGVKS